jgi:hypothetical protein
MSAFQPVPPPPDDLPEMPGLSRRSRYRRPRRNLSLWGLILGLIIGIAAGIYYTWNLAPVVEFDTAPWQLNADEKAQYVVAIMLNYGFDGDLNRTIERLVPLQLGNDPVGAVARLACDLARTGYVDSSSGLRAVRSMMQFYQLQGRSGCADDLLPDPVDAPVITISAPTSTPTLIPPATKTPTPDNPSRASATPTPFFVPTVPSRRDFSIVNVSTFCDAELSGVIEVFVQELNGVDGVPGEAIRVRWDEGEDRFFTGLKPERGSAYADFQMEPGKGYIVEMPGRSDPSQPLAARACTTADLQEAIQSYRVVFRPN